MNNNNNNNNNNINHDDDDDDGDDNTDLFTAYPIEMALHLQKTKSYIKK